MNGKITLGLISAFALVSFMFGLSLATFVDYRINEEQVVLERLTTHKKIGPAEILSTEVDFHLNGSNYALRFTDEPHITYWFSVAEREIQFDRIEALDPRDVGQRTALFEEMPPLAMESTTAAE
ncbi:MAG: hypothetical protein LPJ96_01715 [Exiguobacterium sp.]|uniref:DUF3139 domain-containing protein n=2 Tax=Exiguobacterium alkaliphilum TaxID=1428684 RepID=A0ABT2KTD8_9BACL|nr:MULTISPECIES: hypothetical protein [Exiguobacterium]MDX5322308.1 hypothetical protein [Exiguobacterium sp.]KDN58406.1 hypothetical protein DI14_12385 [Exiguobacterium sp. AB2]MCT4794237.1 hypothetical protein [Exiguobacterium alkaliphilum]MDX5424030.1 hypothetical protein [Exiguobacterium sp.]MDX6771555.1 hypothetical protein [Exiguobacterium sp.]